MNSVRKRERQGCDKPLCRCIFLNQRGLCGTLGATLDACAGPEGKDPPDGDLTGTLRLAIQTVGVLAEVFFSGAATFVLPRVVGLFAPLRSSRRSSARADVAPGATCRLSRACGPSTSSSSCHTWPAS